MTPNKITEIEEKYSNLSKIIPYKWRIQSKKNGWCTVVAYIDARDAMNLLDSAVGPENWQDHYQQIKHSVYCRLGIKFSDKGDWIWKSDVGVPSKIEPEKGEASDAFKRACVKFGLGRFLYDFDMIFLKMIGDSIVHDQQRYGVAPSHLLTGQNVNPFKINEYVNQVILKNNS